jgi:uncharacterized Rmd1/YagE family protein
VSIFATGKSHTIVAYAFAENFRMAQAQAELGASLSLMDPKDSVSREVPGGGWVYAYNFGVLAFWNVSPEARAREIEQFRGKRAEGLSDPAVIEDFIVEEDPGERPRAEFSRLILDKVTPQRAEVVALTVAQSAAMSYYEQLLERSHVKLAGMLAQLERKGHVGRWPARLHRFIAEAVMMRSDVVGVMHLLDRPDLIWEDKIMDGLYDDLRAVFDLKERYQALGHKLDYIQDAGEVLLDMARDSRLFLVEVSIVVLILAEILMSIFR